ncbi:6495_t:CDS:2, partial [Diversispora eburnea]
MATKISTEILIMILRNVQSSRSTQDLYSSLLVNRIWCKVTIPILWELTFGQEYFSNEVKKKSLYIRTYISCMDIQARTLLTQNEFDLSSSPPQATFDYPSFTHKFVINDLDNFVSTYSRQIIGSDQDNSNKDDGDNVFSKSRILFHEMCKLIINRCTFLDYFKVGFPKKFSRNYGDLIGSILDLPDAPKIHMIKCHFSQNLLVFKKRLENLSIEARHIDCDSLLVWAIISQKETLKRKLSPIGQFTSLQKLYIKYFCGLDRSNCLSLASSFTQLSSFHYFQSSHGPEQVIAIFNNNFNELKKFSFDCGEEGFDANGLLWCGRKIGGNKKIIVKRTEQERLFTLSNEYFKVIEECG